jgi:hypothetical protein
MKYICLNLRTRPDRWERAKQQFDKYGLTVERFEAIEHDQPWISFNLSMKAIISQITEPTVVFEDDVELLSELPQPPKEWDLLYYGGNVRSKVSQHDDNWWRCVNTWTTHAVAYTPKMAAYISEHFNHESIIYDEWLRTEVQPVFNCYICKPFAAIQVADYSDLQKSNVNYDLLKTQSNLI